jgi:SAM-dependent methyltransferase
MNVQKVVRIFRDEGWNSLFFKLKKKLTLYKMQKASQNKPIHTGIKMNYPFDMARNWLQSNKNNFGNPFYNLLNFLTTMHKGLESIDHVSCVRYQEYLQASCRNELPFEIKLSSIPQEEDIIQFINAFDQAYIHKMIHAVFIGLIRYLTQQKKAISLLDFGTGASCGLYGHQYGEDLFKNINKNRVQFVGIDDVHKPGGAVFDNSTYIKSNILSFKSNRKFDLITGHHVLEHCFDWEEVMAHISQLMEKGGYVYLSFPRFGGFYDTTYRLMSSLDHCANFRMETLKSTAEELGLKLCFTDIYVDPNFRFNWMCTLFPKLIDREIANCFYDLCVEIDAKKLLGLHLHGNYVVFQKI